MHKLDRTCTCEATFTGLVYRTAGASGSIHASAVREAELKADLADALAQSKVSARRLAQITGRISSMSPALGRAAHFYTRHLQRAVAAAGKRSRAAMERRMLPVRNKIRAELQLWGEEFDTRHGQPLWRTARVCHLFHTDASADRTGAVLNSSGLVEELFRLGDVWRRTVTSLFAEGERAQSSTAREAIGLAVAVDAFAAQLAGTETTAYIDN